MKDLNKALEKNNKRGRICFAMADAFGGAGAFLAKGAVIGLGIGLLRPMIGGAGRRVDGLSLDIANLLVASFLERHIY